MNVEQNKFPYLRDNSKLSSLTITGKPPSKITKGNRFILGNSRFFERVRFPMEKIRDERKVAGIRAGRN